jgi:predicted Co/Zn/Cd cation transporter (cation efflux family)
MSRMSGYMMEPGPVPPDRYRDPALRAAQDDQDLVTFAAFMLVIVGVLNVVYGIAATSHSQVFDRDVTYVFSGLATWGWTWLIVGALQLAAAASITRRHTFGRVVGIVTAAVNAVLQMLAIAGHPFLSVTLLAVDVMVIYALTRHMGRPDAAAPAQ